jgi:ribonucleotide monophosphatase NagD (HAD superfamily)
MFSEGHPERLEQTIAGHAMGQIGYFNEIVMEKKDAQSFKRVGALGRRYLPEAATRQVATVVIGDSLQRDIRYAKEAGFTTIYIPSQFQGLEIPQSDMEQPDFQIESLLELPSVLASLGLDLSDLDLSGLNRTSAS